MTTQDSAEVHYFFETGPWDRLWFRVLLSAVVLGVDFWMGPYIAFPIFSVFPVLLAAWHGRLRWAVAFALVLSIARGGFYLHWNTPLDLKLVIGNTVIRGAMLTLLAVLTWRTARQTRLLRRRLTLLEGILPICGFCKDIRDNSGRWTRLESYISGRSDARFSHGVCPACSEKHYGFSVTRDHAV